MNEMLDTPAPNDIDVDDGPNHPQTNEYEKYNGSPEPDGKQNPKRMDPRLFWVVFPVLCVVIAVFAVITVGVFQVRCLSTSPIRRWLPSKVFETHWGWDCCHFQ